MSTIRKHYRKWQCLVRVKDHPQIIKSFKLREDTKRWGIEIELKIRREDAGITNIKYPTFNEIGLKYIADVSITKKGFVNERTIIKSLFLEPFSTYPINKITPDIIGKFRDSTIRQHKKRINYTISTNIQLIDLKLSLIKISEKCQV